MGRQTKVELFAECFAIIRGLRTKLSHVQVFPLPGKDYTRQELIDLFQSLIDAQHATSAARARWTEAVANERRTFKRVRTVRNKFRAYTEGTLGKGAPALALLGFKAKEPAQPKVEVRLAAIEQRRATRKARGTMGKKQKKQIKGELFPDEKTKKKE